jgi:hypothetical protein
MPPSPPRRRPTPEKSPAGYMKAKAKAARGALEKEEDLFTDKGGNKYRYTVPKKFSNPQESGIIAKVERGSNTLTFEIDESGKVTVNK